MKLLFIILCFFTTLHLTAQELEILYEQRIPYVIKNNNTLKGIVASPLMNALQKANIKFKLKEKTSKRHLYEIKLNKKPVCAIGWFKNSDREKFAKFTNYLYQDKPLGIIYRKENLKMKNIVDVNSLLKNKKLKLLIKTSYSYGNFLDKKIKQSKTTIREVSSDNLTMTKLIAKKRADYMFISHEEATELLKQNNEQLVFQSVKNIPDGNKRYLICSKSTNDDIIKRINSNLRY